MSSTPLSKRRKVSTSTATADIEDNDNIRGLLSSLFNPHAKQKSKKRKVDDATSKAKSKHTSITTPSSAQLKPIHTPTPSSAAVAQEKQPSDANEKSTSTTVTAQSAVTIASQHKPITTNKRGIRQYMKWEDRFNQIKEYYSPNGELMSELPKELYKWIAQQRCAYNKKELRNDQLIKLQSFQDSLLLGNKDKVFKIGYRIANRLLQQRMADSTELVRRSTDVNHNSQAMLVKHQNDPKVWTEEETTKARGNNNTSTKINTSPTSSMDALLSASITIDNNNREEEGSVVKDQSHIDECGKHTV